MVTLRVQPLKAKRLSELVEEHLRELIVKGEISPGEKFPPLLALSKQFGVSTLTVREAVRALEALGFVAKKTGKNGGVYVSEFGIDSVKIPMQYFLALKNCTDRDLVELRMVIEPAAARMAAVRVNPEEIKLMEKNIAYCEKKLNDAKKSLAAKEVFTLEGWNVEFHRLIAEATHNPVLSVTVDYVMDFLRAFKKYIFTRDLEFSATMIECHKAILAMLKKGDAAGAEKEMIADLKNVESYLLQKLAKPMRNAGSLSPQTDGEEQKEVVMAAMGAVSQENILYPA